ncbi:hypothetical protein OROMI_032995 [Orobanche minor]
MMDVNEEEVLISLRNMQNDEEPQENHRMIENGHALVRHGSYHLNNIKPSLQWLDLRVFYVKLSKCVVGNNSTPDFLTLNHIPLSRDTLLEVNYVRSSIYSDGVSTLLKRDRLDKRSEEVTFVSTDSVRTTGSVMFEVFYKDVLVLYGNLEMCCGNGFIGESKSRGPKWSMSCGTDVFADAGYLNGNQNRSPDIEVYVAGSFGGSPIVLSKTLQLSYKKKHNKQQTRKGMLECIPEYESRDDSSTLTIPPAHYQEYKQEGEGACYHGPYVGIEYLEGEDGELSWFNAGVRVGVGIGLSICLGVGIGVGLLVRTYQGTARNLTRRII